MGVVRVFGKSKQMGQWSESLHERKCAIWWQRKSVLGFEWRREGRSWMEMLDTSCGVGHFNLMVPSPPDFGQSFFPPISFRRQRDECKP